MEIKSYDVVESVVVGESEGVGEAVRGKFKGSTKRVRNAGAKNTREVLGNLYDVSYFLRIVVKHFETNL